MSSPEHGAEVELGNAICAAAFRKSLDMLGRDHTKWRRAIVRLDNTRQVKMRIIYIDLSSTRQCGGRSLCTRPAERSGHGLLSSVEKTARPSTPEQSIGVCDPERSAGAGSAQPVFSGAKRRPERGSSGANVCIVHQTFRYRRFTSVQLSCRSRSF